MAAMTELHYKMVKMLNGICIRLQNANSTVATITNLHTIQSFNLHNYRKPKKREDRDRMGFKRLLYSIVLYCNQSKDFWGELFSAQVNERRNMLN